MKFLLAVLALSFTGCVGGHGEAFRVDRVSSEIYEATGACLHKAGVEVSRGDVNVDITGPATEYTRQKSSEKRNSLFVGGTLTFDMVGTPCERAATERNRRKLLPPVPTEK